METTDCRRSDTDWSHSPSLGQNAREQQPDLRDPSQRTWARRCSAGNELAIRFAATTNNQLLFRAAWSILKDRGEAEDAVQSAYLKAFALADCERLTLRVLVGLGSQQDIGGTS